ncbi:Uncharacterized protein ALO42_01125 [Pseudomonas syringae pv. atrofaciens]|nr:Hypothetical protein PSSB64_1223 [Pseudomonas syringae pv. syringae B64]EPF68731.1 hypothetical protein PssSM_4762 [Pseudomonas syringae pv. syringae SM]KPW08151.1 Uncharacterized protein ALO42_01125 [Pseudomonas syringae pv. atrofaciens]RML37663.1 hypothetical protein ALQ96_02536 [Pseudomonas syringae pv. atrofaciens]
MYLELGRMAEESKPQYPRGDVRRLLRLALAMAELERPTLNTLAAETGHHKQTILDDMPRLREQLGVMVEKEGSEYRLRDWGPVVKKAGIRKFLKGQMG